MENKNIHKTPFFSIIIPVYNKGNFIYNTLQSVVNQDFNSYEVIIIDDGSTDCSADIISTFLSEKIQYHFIENQGVANARNIGIQKAKADYVAFLDADDCWTTDYLQNMFVAINKFPNERVFACALRFEVLNKIISSVYSFKYSSDYQLVNYFEGSLKQSVLTSSSTIFHKIVFEKSGLFNPKYQVGEDTDLWVRVGIHFPVVFIHKEMVLYKFDPIGLSNNRKKYIQKADFEQYIELEKTNQKLKTFLDYNRFSLALESKMEGDYKLFKKYVKQIDLTNLSFKKRILICLPVFLLKFLVYLKQKMALLDLGNSVFK